MGSEKVMGILPWPASLTKVVARRTEIRTVSLNITKKYFADPANVKSYDFEDSLLGGQASAFGGNVGTSLLPGHRTSRNPSPVPTAPANEKREYYQDTDRQP